MRNLGRVRPILRYCVVWYNVQLIGNTRTEPLPVPLALATSTVRKNAISDERVWYCALCTHSVAWPLCCVGYSAITVPQDIMDSQIVRRRHTLTIHKHVGKTSRQNQSRTPLNMPILTWIMVGHMNDVRRPLGEGVAGGALEGGVAGGALVRGVADRTLIRGDVRRARIAIAVQRAVMRFQWHCATFSSAAAVACKPSYSKLFTRMTGLQTENDRALSMWARHSNKYEENRAGVCGVTW